MELRVLRGDIGVKVTFQFCLRCIILIAPRHALAAHPMTRSPIIVAIPAIIVDLQCFFRLNLGIELKIPRGHLPIANPVPVNIVRGTDCETPVLAKQERITKMFNEIRTTK